MSYKLDVEDIQNNGLNCLTINAVLPPQDQITAYYFYNLDDDGAGSGFAGPNGDPLVLNNYSLVTQGKIATLEIDLTSSKEIKNVIGPIKDFEAEVEDLFTKIPFFKYQYKDVVNEGTVSHYGVIAEELREVAPHLVSNKKNFVPNVYQKAKVSEIGRNKDGSYKYTLSLATELKGEKLTNRLQIFDLKYSCVEVDLLEQSATTLIISSLKQLNDEVFVYGCLKNCPGVTKNKIFEIGMIMIQKLLTENKQLHKRLQILEGKQP